MQLDGIAFADGGLAILVSEGQNAVFIGVGALVGDTVGGKFEHVGSVGGQLHGRTGIIRGDGDRLSCFFGGLFGCFFDRLFSRFFFSSNDFIAGEGAVSERPDGFRNSIQHGRIFTGIIGAVGCFGIAEFVTGGTAHLTGIGIQGQFKHGMCGR